MFDYLQQFNSLPKDLRDKVSSPAAMAVINDLENKYQTDLAMTVMKILIKSLAVKNLPAYFISELGLPTGAAENLSRDLKEKLLAPVADYLGIISEMRALDLDKDIETVIQEAGLILPSVDLVNRFKSILSTYLKGIRNKIDARAAFAKPVSQGGLNLSAEEAARVFKVCDSQKFKSIDVVLAAPTVKEMLPPPVTKLDKLIDSAEKSAVAGEYNLKQALASGQVKKPAALDLAHELEAADKILDLPLPEKIAAVNLTPKAVKMVVPPTAKIVPPLAPPAPIAAKTAPVARPLAGNRPVAAPAGGKPKIQDIKPMPKVMGPTEELQFLDLVNFRRLGQNPAETTAKIFSKIKLLERDGYDKMINGVRAWRQSPVNRLYIRLGQEALAKGVTLQETIDARQKANQEYLKMEEIEALVSLNSKLVF